MKKQLFFLCLMFFLSCKEQIRFNKEAWADYSIDNSHREGMLNDLFKHYKLKGLSNKELTDLLDRPQFTDSLELTYEIYVDYDVIDPRSGELLIFYLNRDSVVTDYKLKKWSNRRQKWWMWH